MPQYRAHPVFADGGTTVFEVMSRLARDSGAINLGQGFPDHGEPPEVIEAACAATRERSNQYPPMLGIPELRAAVAAHAERFYGLAVDATSEVMVTSGATEALAAAILAFVGEGDEVVAFEPMYDCYAPLVRRAGGTVVPVRLEPPAWSLDASALEAAFSARTKAVILNNPMNPTGKLFGMEELALIARCVARSDAVAIADEVYEHLVFDGTPFTPLMAMPGMRRRTIRIGSAGKTFSLTGWKVGYATADPALLGPMSRCHQFLTFTTPPNLQYAVAQGLALGKEYFSELTGRLSAKRDRLATALQRVGMTVLPCQGTYFLVADISPLGTGRDDFSFCTHMIEAAGVAAIPLGPFYERTPPPGLVRFCFAKTDGVLDEAARRLEGYFAAGRRAGARSA